ncbi:RNA polymerase sigma factor [Solicola sp. PLA-1-18]|uniref:RNA polymerase sigma factor n=1 Tax=Solicola sp. PLA-1-18 TaxID=3380532 RepID=UPI003B77AEC3
MSTAAGPPRSWADASDEALVRAARLDDQTAFAEVVDRYGSSMLGYARRLVGDQHDAADVVQAAFVSAWRGLPTFQGRSALRTWLFRLVQRRAADLARTRRPTPVDDRLLSAISPADRRDPLQGVLDSELLEALHAALAELPWHQRSVWLLREFEDMSYTEIAEVLAITPGSVRMHLHRGRRTLAERMARWR